MRACISVNIFVAKRSVVATILDAERQRALPFRHVRALVNVYELHAATLFDAQSRIVRRISPNVTRRSRARAKRRA